MGSDQKKKMVSLWEDPDPKTSLCRQPLPRCHSGQGSTDLRRPSLFSVFGLSLRIFGGRSVTG